MCVCVGGGGMEYSIQDSAARAFICASHEYGQQQKYSAITKVHSSYLSNVLMVALRPHVVA